MTANDQWYYTRSGEQQGPLSLADLQSLISSGQLARSEMAWQVGMPQWTQIGSIPAFCAATGPVPPPLPTMTIGYSGPMPPPRSGVGDDPAMRWLVPVGRSGWAIAAGYLGLLSFVIFPAPLALIISIIAVWDIKKHPGRHGMGRAIFGLIMGILGTILFVPMVFSMAMHR